MTKRWLDLFFRFAGFTHKLRQKVAKETGVFKTLHYALFLMVVELVFAAVSIPMYLSVSPNKLQEKGFVFPAHERITSPIHTYVMRRKISLVTFFGVAVAFLAKLFFVFWASFLLLSGNILLAASEGWAFDIPSNYTYDTAKIEVTGGMAQLKLSNGQITDPVVDSLTFDATNSADASVINIAGNIYAVAYTGAAGDGFVTTMQVGTDGQIGDAVIDTYEFEGANGATPDIIHISGDVYAIVYSGVGSDGFIITLSIATDGTITHSIIDTLEYDVIFGGDAEMIHISGDIFAVVYQGDAADGYIATVEISTAGAITDVVVDSFEYDVIRGVNPDIINISGNIYAIAYSGEGSDGYVTTLEISTAGAINTTAIDVLEFDATMGDDPYIFAISGDIYGIAYSGVGVDGFVATIEVSSAGVITNTVVDSFEYDVNRAVTPSVQSIGNNIYAIAYEGDAGDGFLQTVRVSTAGAITTTTLDLFEFDTVGGSDTTMIPISGDYYAVVYRDPSGSGRIITVEIVTGYPSDSPTITPTSSLAVSPISSWDSFTETATKNGGEIYYQLSDDNGATWQYWNGSIWTTAGATDYNAASTVNTNIGSFSLASEQLMWKAFLSSDGLQLITLDNIDVGYTLNDLPDVLNLSGAQRTTEAGLVDISYDLADDNGDTSSLSSYEYSLTGAFGGEEASMTAATGDSLHEGVSSLAASASGTAHVFVWDTFTDLGLVYDDSVYVRLRGNDGTADGGYASSSAFIVDFVLPVVSNVSAAQTVGSSNVSISYDLADDTPTGLFIEVDVSEDSGATWNVSTSTTSGDVGASVSAGSGKTINWEAGTDFGGQEQGDIRVRVRARDNYYNQGLNVESSDFSLDTTTPAPSTPPPSGGGGGAPLEIFMPDNTPPDKPILNQIVSPTNNSLLAVSGLSEPRSIIALYDNDVFVVNLNSLADDSGKFGQSFEFIEGPHSIKVAAKDAGNNVSIFSNSVVFTVDLTPPPAPVILFPKEGEEEISTSPTITGTAEPQNLIKIIFGGFPFNTNSNSDGTWEIIIPKGIVGVGETVEISASAVDTAGNESDSTNITISTSQAEVGRSLAEVVEIPAQPSAPILPTVVVPIVTEPIVEAITPVVEIEPGIIEAVEIPELPVPEISSVVTEVAGNNFNFSGTALPNTTVVVYINSEQTLVYTTKSDSNGRWAIEHSQEDVALHPGEHTIFAVSVDEGSKVKTPISSVRRFVVRRNFWVMVYNHLNLQTTIISMGVLLLAVWYIFRLRFKEQVVEV